jgi:CheY-like chemotaxis protein
MPIVPVGSVHPGPCILIAEDNEVYLETVRSYLEHLGYRTCVARTGVAALERAGLQPTPDLILMDVQLPVIDGLEAIRRLRRNPHVSKLPIVAMTALAMPGDRERCMEAGASAYISKPVHLTELAMLIQQQLAG